MIANFRIGVDRLSAYCVNLNILFNKSFRCLFSELFIEVLSPATQLFHYRLVLFSASARRYSNDDRQQQEVGGGRAGSNRAAVNADCAAQFRHFPS